ncbi:MAG: PQQ-binding-like beta-propeller repeat protein [Pyrinomonadaceae bacterium]
MNVIEIRSLALVIFVLALPFGGIGQATQEKRPGIVECASRAVEFPAPNTLLSDEDRLYLGTASGNILALRRSDLAIEWRAELGGDVVSSLISNGTNIFAVNEPSENGSEDRKPVSTVRAIRKASGIVDWSVMLPFSGPVHLIRSNGVLFAAGNGGSIAVVDEKTGAIMRQTKAGDPIIAAAASQTNGLVIATKGKGLKFLTAASDEGTSPVTNEFTITAVLAKSDGGLIVGDERGYVFEFNGSDPSPSWRFRSGAQISGLFEVEDGVLITSYDNFLYYVSDYNGDVIWKRRLSGRLNGPGMLLNGYFLIADPAESTIVAVDRRTGKVIDIVVLGDGTSSIGGIAGAGTDRFAAITSKGIRLFAIGGCGPK